MRKKINFKYLVSALIIGFALISCEDDDTTNISSSVKPNLTAEVTTLTVNEGEQATLNFTLDRAFNKPIQYRLVMLDESTATDQDDYIIPGCRSNDPDCVAIEENGGPVGYIFEIPPYTTNYSVNIETILDELNESTENLKLKVISNRTLFGTVGDLVFDISIVNTVSDDLSIRFNWDGTFESGGDAVDFCDIDLDLELYNSTSAQPILTSYNDCPEKIVMESSLADGDYTLIASFWSASGYSETVNIPAFLTFYKAGSTFNQTLDLSESFPLDQGGLDDGNDAAYRFYTITKAGTTYTVKDETDTVVAEGRMSNLVKNFKKRKSLKK